MSNAAPALTREARKAQTRQALIEAASELFARQGIEATALDEVAAHVGLTKGAVYTHFANKAALVEEVLQAASAVVDPAELLDPTQTLEERFAHLGREAAALIPKIPRRSIMLHVEYYLYVLRDRARHRTSMRDMRRSRAEGGKALESAQQEGGARLPIPGRELAAILEAIGQGLVVEVARDPDAISPASIELFFAALGRGLDT